MSSFFELFLAYSTSSLFSEKFDTPFIKVLKSSNLFENFSKEYLLILFTLIAISINFIARLIWLYYTNFTWFKLSTRLNKKVCEILINQEFNTFREKKTGQLSNILNAQSTTISGDFLYPICALLQPLSSSILVLGYGLLVETRITTLILLIVGSIYLLILYVGKSYFSKFSKNILKSQQDIQSFTNSGLNSIKEIKTSQKEFEFLEKYTLFDRKYRKSQYLGRLIQLSPKTIIESVGLLTIILLILIDFKKGNGIVISASEIVLLAIIFKSVLSNIQAVYNNISQLIISSAAQNHVFELLSSRQNTNLISRQNSFKNPIIVFEKNNNFSFVVEKQEIIFSQFDFFKTNEYVFKSGQIFGINGPSGSGKTTYLDFLSGLHTNLKIKNITNSHISYMTQFNYINDIPIHSYLEIDIDNENILNKYFDLFYKLKLVKNNINEFKQFLKIRLSFSASKLSGGQIKRLALIKSICSGARILLLDEFTNGLNKELEIVTLNVIKEFVNKKNLVILISHNENVKSYCDKLIDISLLTKYYKY